MALVYVGGTSGVGTTATYAVSLSGTLTGGIASSPSEGDIVVVFSGFGNTAAVAPTCSGNSSGAYGFVDGTTSYHQNDTWDAEFAGRYAIQGATVDTTLTIGRVANAAYGGATVVQVWRGVDATTPFDVAATVAGAGNTGLIDPAAITPVTAGAVILAGGTGTQTTAGSAFVVSSNMAGPSVTTFGNGTTSDTGTCIASHDWTSGAFDPNVVTGGTVSTSCAWRAMTLALRPEPAAVNADISITGVAATGAVGTVTASGSSDATATTTGVAATGAVGTASAKGDAAVALTGVSGTGSVGTVAANGEASVALTGASGTGAAGTVSANGNAVTSITGVSGTGAVGDAIGGVVLPFDFWFSGALGTDTVGTLVLATNIPGQFDIQTGVTGVSGTAAVGSVAASGASIANLTGVSSAASVGSVSVAGTGTTATTGVSGTGTVGSVTAAGDAAVSLIGVAGIVTVGSVATAGTASTIVTGVIGTSAVGSVGTSVVAPRVDVSVDVTGVAATGVAGSVTATGAPVVVSDTMHRPKSTNTMRLQRISEGRVYATRSYSMTRGNRARAEGSEPKPTDTLFIPGQISCVSTHKKSHTNPVRAKSGACVTVQRSRARSQNHTIVARCGASAGALSYCSASSASAAMSSGIASAKIYGSASSSAYNAAKSRGVRNLTPVEIAVAVRVAIDMKSR